MNFKKLLCLGLVGVLSLSTMSCGSKESEASANPENSDGEKVVYNITICRGTDSEFDDALILGFTDALSDYLGEDGFATTEVSTDTITSAYTSVLSSVGNGADLIFTTDKYTLQGAASATEEVPIVATGVVDFQGTLRIASTGDSSWDKTTGRNITGVTSRPSIVDQTSLLIEATEDLQTVGILFSSEDTDAIYQNEILEKYLDQAGIPWKEYSIPVTEEAMEESESEQGTTAITPTKLVAPSAKEGSNNQVVSLGEETGVITGLNSTSSTRTAKISKFWKNGKVIPTEATEENSSESDDSVKKSDAASEDKPDLETIIRTACGECSVLYIPFDSLLTDQMEVIGEIATESQVVTVAGDTTIAENCLVTLYVDPYSMGYSAGKKAKKILVDNSDPASMKITASADDSIKLYNGEVATKFGISFPKSFKELHTFLETYEIGSTTERVTVEQ